MESRDDNLIFRFEIKLVQRILQYVISELRSSDRNSNTLIWYRLRVTRILYSGLTANLESRMCEVLKSWTVDYWLSDDPVCWSLSLTWAAFSIYQNCRTTITLQKPASVNFQLLAKPYCPWRMLESDCLHILPKWVYSISSKIYEYPLPIASYCAKRRTKVTETGIFQARAMLRDRFLGSASSRATVPYHKSSYDFHSLPSLGLSWDWSLVKFVIAARMFSFKCSSALELIIHINTHNFGRLNGQLLCDRVCLLRETKAVEDNSSHRANTFDPEL